MSQVHGAETGPVNAVTGNPMGNRHRHPGSVPVETTPPTKKNPPPARPVGSRNLGSQHAGCRTKTAGRGWDPVSPDLPMRSPRRWDHREGTSPGTRPLEYYGHGLEDTESPMPAGEPSGRLRHGESSTYNPGRMGGRLDQTTPRRPAASSAGSTRSTCHPHTPGQGLTSQAVRSVARTCTLRSTGPDDYGKVDERSVGAIPQGHYVAPSGRTLQQPGLLLRWYRDGGPGLLHRRRASGSSLQLASPPWQVPGLVLKATTW